MAVHKNRPQMNWAHSELRHTLGQGSSRTSTRTWSVGVSPQLLPTSSRVPLKTCCAWAIPLMMIDIPGAPRTHHTTVPGPSDGRWPSPRGLTPPTLSKAATPLHALRIEHRAARDRTSLSQGPLAHLVPTVPGITPPPHLSTPPPRETVGGNCGEANLTHCGRETTVPPHPWGGDCSHVTPPPPGMDHIVTDSEIVWAGLQGKCAKWERHGWVGSRGALAHRDLWMQLWQSWQLSGDSVSIQWVPSHAGVEGNEQADKCAVRGAELSLPGVVREKEASEVWRELGLEEMPEQDEEPEENWDAVDSETDSTDAGSTADSTDAEMMSESEEGGSSECELVCRPQKSGRVR